MKRMVIGFLFDEMTRVLLVNKNKPDWQAGRWNGVGGKVKPGESIDHAMAREFYEETGILIAISEWNNFASVGHADDWMISFYTARWGQKFLEFDSLAGLITNFPDENAAGEKLGAYFVHSIDHLPLVQHTRWLAHLAFDTVNVESQHFTHMEVIL